MAQPPSLQEVLTKKAMLLMRREQELFRYRQDRARAETWLAAFHALSQQLKAKDERALVERWTDQLVEKLGFQIAGVHGHDPAEARLVLEWCQPPSALDPAVPLEAGEWDHLEAHPDSRHPSADTPSPLQRLAGVLRLGKFHWLALQVDGRDFLLVAGYSPEAAPFHVLSEADQAQFTMLGNHLGALLNSVRLLASLGRERTDLQRANAALERAHARTREEMEERLALEKKVRHGQKLEALGQLTAGISHEVNNPLACVLANLSYCRREVEEIQRHLLPSRGEELGTAIREAIEAAERIERIIRDVKQFARPDEGSLTSVDVRDALEMALKMCRNEIVHRARLVTEYQDVPAVHGDARRLQQVFINLLTNAAQALRGDTEGTIRVVTRREGPGGVCVEIHDSGTGISPDIADRVCDPFFTTRPIGQGTGLGLWVCRSILQGCDGQLELGQADGGGTVARVHLRARTAGPLPSRPAAAPPPVAPAPGVGRARVLIVDDEPAVARSVARLLPEHDTHVASTVQDALAAYQAQAFDAVVCDLMMPVAGGAELLAALQALGPAHAGRVVLMTAGAFTPAARALVSSIPNSCLGKPLVEQQLRAAIERACRVGAGRDAAS